MFREIPLWILLISLQILYIGFFGYMGWWLLRYTRKTPAQQRKYRPMYLRIAVGVFIVQFIRNIVFRSIEYNLVIVGFDNHQIELVDLSLRILNPLLGSLKL